ncbi:MAG: ABC transporter substrate-binding protein [Myxococcales bacterium]|jgi:ABC-type transport system substrate-binding protein|nr:ABC transporter substrate-binding protein [Myxococcales bacterium]
MRWTRDAARAVAIACAAVGLGCAGELEPPVPAAHPDDPTPRRGGVLHLASFADMRVIDPANIADGLVPRVNQAIFAGLVDYDGSGRVVPDLAERWEVLDGGRRYRFFLRAGVRFHDGEELTADDVVRSMERALHPSAPNPYASFYESIVGFAEIQDKKSEALAGVTAEGKYVVDVRLKDVDATFLPALGLQVLRPVCKSAGRRYSDTWQPCGAGPFKLLPGGWDKGRQITLVRHDGYFRPGLPYLDAISWSFLVNTATQRFKFETGALDLLQDFRQAELLRFQRDPRWKPLGEYEAERQVGAESMNTELAPFDNVEIRRAVAAAIDRDHIRLIRPGNLRAAGLPIPPAVLGANPSLPGQRYDLGAALEHMKKAGYPYDPATGRGGYPHPIRYVIYRQGLSEYTVQLLAQDLAKIGLRLDVQVVNYPSYLAITHRRGKAQMTSAGWQQDYPDPSDFLDPLFHSRAINDEDSNNVAFYKNPRLDALLDRARRELDPPTRQRLYDEAQGIVVDEAPWAFTHYYRWYDAHQAYVRGYKPHPVWTHNVSFSWLDRGPSAQAGLAPRGPSTVLGLLGGRRGAP